MGTMTAAPHSTDRLKLSDLLPEVLLEAFRARAGAYDAENRFCAEDLAELKQSGYLAAGVPASFGGSGLTLADLSRAQRRLAAAAPATALAVNMHLVWAAVARLLHDAGDARMDWVLREIAQGEVYAFGISEPGNDAVLMDAHTSAVSAADSNGDVLVSGTKVFTTLSPVWTRLGVHARHGDALIFGFIRRDGTDAPRTPSQGSLGLASGSLTHPGEWNPLGMRATQSWTTHIEAVPMRGEDVVARTTPFPKDEPLVGAIFAAFSVLTASVYAGIADRALQLADAAALRDHAFLDGRVGPLLDDPDVAARLTRAHLEHRLSVSALEQVADEAVRGSTRPDWFVALATVKNRVTDEAREAVLESLRLAGTRGYQAESELARLYRDVLAGMFHPSSARSLAGMIRGVISG